MALKDPRSGRWWSRLHFGVRFVGVTAVLAAVVGLTVILIDGALTWEVLQASWDKLVAAAQGQSEGYPRRAMLLLMAGVVVGLFWLFLEALIVVRVVAGRRSAFGFNAAVQIVLATALLIGVNVYSGQHYRRIDLTSGHRFTLPTEPIDVPAELAKLTDETTIVVYERYKKFDQLSDKSDGYDSAAERKVVEKVKDLAELFREFGKQFRVEVLEVEEGYEKKRDELVTRLARESLRLNADDKDLSGEQKKALDKKTVELRDAIESVPENSIFFFAGGRLQRLSFNEFYQLDKTASRDASDKRGNLVLLFQGVEPFARRALDIDQRRPKAGILVIHEWLTSEGPEEFGVKGVKTALNAHGIDVKDIVLRRWSDAGPGEPEPAVYTHDESKYERIEEELAALDDQIAVLDKLLKQYSATAKLLEKSTLEELSKTFAKELGGEKMTEPLRQINLRNLRMLVAGLEREIVERREEREASLKEKVGLNVDQLGEQRRLTDLKSKLNRQLADCDLIILPRLTYINLVREWRVGSELHKLDKAQIEAIKDYMKAGKPVLACFGPINEPGNRMGMPGRTEPDELEELFGQLGVQFGKSVVLYNADAKAFADARVRRLAAGSNVDVPPVEFNWKPEALRLPGKIALDDAPERDPNPIRRSMKIAQASVGKSLSIQSHYPRPVSVDGNRFKNLPYDPVIMITGSDSWNEDNPFPSREWTPHFTEPKPDDSRNNTFDARRRGPFPIAVALETTVPAEWYSDKPAQPAKTRVAVIGDGNLFVGRELSPAKERLLMYTCNWLLGRDDLLPRDDRTWEYPRVDLSERDRKLWYAGAWLGPPLLFLYVGLIVMFVRRLR